MFQRAIDLDPSYAAAYAELGLSLIEAVASGWTEFVADALGRAETLAQKALSLDPATTNAHRLLAEIDLMRGHFDLALGQVERALEINPSDAESFTTRGIVLLFAGRAAEAVPWLEGALRLDRTNARAPVHLGMAYYFLGRYGEAVEAMDRALAGNRGRNTPADGATRFGSDLWRSWTGRRTPSESGPQRCACRRFSAPSGSPRNSARRRPATICSKG